jgi:hypothetical protein
MILKASQRGGAKALGQHLLKAENEQVEVHEIRGFVSDNLMGAMKEAQAVAKGTRCKQFLFSVSLNPPETESIGVEAFEAAIEKIEEANGLSGQPRMIVFHEKEGRRHAHAVWSRIDAETMTARQLSHFKLKLREVSKGLYLEHGWQMPRGLMDSKERDPRNFTLAEWQQAKRVGKDPRQLKTAIQECWTISDNRDAFAKALESRGLYLAKGDRRAHVVVTYEGEVLSLARTIGKRTKDVTAKLGKADDLRGVDDTRAHIGSVIAPKLKELIAVADKAKAREMSPLNERRIAMREQHAAERQRMDEGQNVRAQMEAKTRAERLRPGIMGLWDRMSGERGRTNKRNEAEAFECFRRDRQQRNELVADQLKERRILQREIVAVRARHAGRVSELHRDLTWQNETRQRGETLRERFTDAAISTRGNSDRITPSRQNNGSNQRGNGRGQVRGPSFER